MLERIEIDGVSRWMGWIPPVDPPRLQQGLPLFALDKSAWSEFEYTQPTQVKDQGNLGACNGHAAASTLELAYWIGLGSAPVPPLSAWFVYATLCNGLDRGSNIGDALTLLQGQGTCLDSLVPYSTINPRQISQDAHTDAERHKISLGGTLETWDDICNAIQLRRPVNLSVRAASNWSDLDASGVPPINIGMGNHAVGVGWGMRHKDGDWQIKMQNSWSTKWGQNGYCWLTRRHWELQSYREAYYVEVATAFPGTEPPRILV